MKSRSHGVINNIEHKGIFETYKYKYVDNIEEKVDPVSSLSKSIGIFYLSYFSFGSSVIIATL